MTTRLTATHRGSPRPSWARLSELGETKWQQSVMAARRRLGKRSGLGQRSGLEKSSGAASARPDDPRPRSPAPRAGVVPRERETTPRQPRLGAVRGSAPGLPRGPYPGAPRLGAVPHLNDTLRTISDHARRFGGGQWSNRSVSRGSWQHEPGHRGRSRGCLGVVSGHRGKPKLVSCPETAPRQPRDLPRCQNPTFPERLSTLLPSSSSMPSKSAMKFAR